MSSGVGTFNFTNMQNLTGGTVTDDFIFDNLAGEYYGVTGTVSGGGGSATVDLSAFNINTAPVAVTLGLTSGSGSVRAGTVSTGTVSFAYANVATVLANHTVTGNTITGSGSATGSVVWTINGTNAVNVDGTDFATFENLASGTGTNKYVFTDQSALTGSITGNGADQMNFSQYTTAVTVNLQSGAISSTSSGVNIVPVFTGINTVTGAGTPPNGSTTTPLNTIIAVNSSATSNSWTITGTNAGSVDAVAFTAFRT